MGRERALDILQRDRTGGKLCGRAIDALAAQLDS
jgi:hypothetical protein